MKQCPCCGSGKVVEGKTNGIWWIKCHACGYDSAERDRSRDSKRWQRQEREKERSR